MTAMHEDRKRSTSFERPKTADTSASFSRPRTANAAVGRSSDLHHPAFKIDFMAGGEIFSFPTPSLVPKSATLHIPPSALNDLPSPAIGVAIGSPSHARPGWGRSITADSASPRMPSQPLPTRPPPALPNHPDLEIPLATIKRRKPSWRNLSLLFGRRPEKLVYEEPLFRLKMPNAIEDRDILIPDLAELPERGTTPLPPFRCRSPSLTRGQARFESRAEADKAALMPSGQFKTLRSPAEIQKDSFSPMFRTINGIPEDDVWINDPRKDSPLSLMSPQSFSKQAETNVVVQAPHLDLDLPDPKFERYSIMFEKLLVENRPSLLERRQSRLGRVQSVKKLELSSHKVEPTPIPRLEVNGVPESITIASPSLATSLSYRIGKKILSPVAEAFTALHRPRPVQRSKTAPPLPTSPLARVFAKLAIEIPSASSPASECHTDFSLPPTPLTFTTISESGSMGEMDEQCKVAHLRTRSPTEHRAHVSVAREVDVRKSLEQGRGSVESTQPLRPKMVELFKNRTSAAVLIEVAED